MENENTEKIQKTEDIEKVPFYKTKKGIMGIIGVCCLGIILLFAIGIILGGQSDDNISFENDIVGQGNPGVSFDLHNSAQQSDKAGYATVFQWIESKSGKEYKDVQIRVDLYKDGNIIGSKDTIISSLKEPQDIFVVIDIDEEPDYAKTTVINATPVNND